MNEVASSSVEKLNNFQAMLTQNFFSSPKILKTRDKASRNIYNFQFH